MPEQPDLKPGLEAVLGQGPVLLPETGLERESEPGLLVLEEVELVVRVARRGRGAPLQVDNTRRNQRTSAVLLVEGSTAKHTWFALVDNTLPHRHCNTAALADNTLGRLHKREEPPALQRGQVHFGLFG